VLVDGGGNGVAAGAAALLMAFFAVAAKELALGRTIDLGAFKKGVGA